MSPRAKKPKTPPVVKTRLDRIFATERRKLSKLDHEATEAARVAKDAIRRLEDQRSVVDALSTAIESARKAKP